MKSNNISDEMMTQLQEAEKLIQNNNENMKKLYDDFQTLQDIAKKSSEEVNSAKSTVKLVQDIALNTRILGFNAYIEAARAKENGKGFGVVTQEIRGLADVSKESADKIENSIKLIYDFTSQIEKQIKDTEKVINECNENIKQFSEILKTMMTISEEQD